MFLIFINQYTTRTVHRFNGMHLLINSGKIHIILIVVPVTGALPEPLVKDNWGNNFLITGLAVLFLPEIYQLIPQYNPSGMEKGETLTLLMKAKQIKFPSQFSVIPLFGFLQFIKIFF